MDLSNLSKIILDYGSKVDYITTAEILSLIKRCYRYDKPIKIYKCYQVYIFCCHNGFDRKPQLKFPIILWVRTTK